MKKVLFFMTLLIALSATHSAVAFQKKDSAAKGTEAPKADPAKADPAKADAAKADQAKADAAKANAPAEDKSSKKADAENFSESKQVINLTIIYTFIFLIVLLLVLFFMHLSRHRQRIGFQSIKLIGLTLIFPGICILAIVGGGEVLSGQTLAALLGTIAGYVLSRDGDDDVRSNEAALQRKIKELEEKLAAFKAKFPNEVI